ncbi:calcium-binding protein [Shimia sp. MIT1388]|uniref:calcium-binding protein n=1 Tax=Shimia sp. MIT1388 TaxID=3096992 RepID=UPI00399A8B72
MTSVIVYDYATFSPSLTGSEFLTVTQSGFLQTSTGTSVTATNSGSEIGSMSVYGVINNVAIGNARILDFDGAEFNVLIGASGSVSSTGSNNSHGLMMDVSDRSMIINHGSISATWYGIHVNQTSANAVLNLTNTGTISAQHAVSLDIDGIANIRNSGHIDAGSMGVYIRARETSFTEFLNSGTVTSSATAIYSYSANETSVEFDLQNTGTIAGNGYGVAVSGSNTTAKILNAGTISAGSSAIYSLNSEMDIVNTGDIIGDVTLNVANDRIVNSGLIQGEVYLGAGDDVLDTRGGTITNTIFGESGNDVFFIDQSTVNIFEYLNDGTDLVYSAASSYTLAPNIENLVLLGSDDINGFGNSLGNELFGNDGNNRLGGRGGNDTIAGGGGADTLMGGTGNDSVNGDDGNDRISLGTGNDEGIGGNGDDVVQGSLGNDLVTGGNGADTLLGNQGADTLQGGNGDDLLIGGTGQDMMAGGNGGDVFLFRLQGDSKIGSHDRIFDFDVTEDRLDLSPLGIQDINLLSTFSYGGAPSVRTTEIGSSTQIFIDLDGLGGADMRIDLSGTTGLGVEDFIL